MILNSKLLRCTAKENVFAKLLKRLTSEWKQFGGVCDSTVTAICGVSIALAMNSIVDGVGKKLSSNRRLATIGPFSVVSLAKKNIGSIQTVLELERD